MWTSQYTATLTEHRVEDESSQVISESSIISDHMVQDVEMCEEVQDVKMCEEQLFLSLYDNFMEALQG